MSKKVIVIGGGVAGMSAAHELIKRGFSVEVYEARGIPGGKARSVSVPKSGVGGRKDLPGEHGFRFFPRFYRNLPQTMRGTPYGNNHKSTFDNLVQASRELIARAESPNVLTLARFPRTLADFKVLLEDVFAPIGLTSEEEHFAAERLWQIATSCKERRANDYERLSWWEYVEADRFSDNYRALFAVGFTRTLVAARARSASTAVGGSILLQLIYGAATPGPSTDRLLNGPTNDMWIDPWLAYLRKLGVDYRLNSPVTHVHCSDGLIQKIDVNTDEGSLSVEGDYFLFAVPIEVMAKFLESSDILKLDQSLETLLELSDDVAWMNGMQLYLNKEIDLDYGHTMYVDSPWALTSVSQIQFWQDFDLSEYGDGKVKGILSIDISNWDAKGLLEHPPEGKRKSAEECTKEEIKKEVVAQMAKSLNKEGQEPVLLEEDVQSWYLDSDIEPADLFSTDDRYKDAEPLLVNKINTWHLRPETHTHIPNLFLAADYVKTDISLATMEGANEAARRAVNGIIDSSGENAPYCKVYPLQEPWVLALHRYADKKRYQRGLPWNGKLGIFGR